MLASEKTMGSCSRDRCYQHRSQLKGTGDGLPLKKPGRTAVISSDAAPPARSPDGFLHSTGPDGVLAMGRGPGTANFTHLTSQDRSYLGTCEGRRFNQLTPRRYQSR